MVVQHSFFLFISKNMRIQQIKINTIAVIMIFSLNSIKNMEQILDRMGYGSNNIRWWTICYKSKSWNSTITRLESIKSAQMWWIPNWSSSIWAQTSQSLIRFYRSGTSWAGTPCEIVRVNWISDKTTVFSILTEWSHPELIHITSPNN